MIDVNEKMIYVADSLLKANIIELIEQLYKDFGLKADTANIEYMAGRLMNELNKRYRHLDFGCVVKSFDNMLTGKFLVTKLNVHNLLSAIQKQCEWSGSQSKVIPEDVQIEVSNIIPGDNSISRASVWMITKRCDGYNVDNFTVKEVAEYIAMGKNPDELLKN